MHKAVIDAGIMDIMPVDLVEFTSTGRLLVIGSEQQIDAVLPHLEGLKIITTQQAALKIEGWLGKFQVELETEMTTVDLVLDLFDKTAITSSVLPLGYFAPRDNAQELAEALQQLPDLIGTFDKPRYFDYKASICAHSRRQLVGCSQCIDTCPAEAIVSTGDTVTVNPSLCQGCGSCTAVCPSGAMSYVLPSLDVSLNRLRTMLKTYFDHETKPPQLIIHDADKGQMMIDAFGEQLSNTVICFSIEEIGALAMPFWLSAFAYGVASITVWDAGSHTDHDWLALQKEIKKTNQLLTGLSYADNIVNWCSEKTFDNLLNHIDASTKMPIIKPARFAGIDDKRRMITVALEHLHKQSSQAIDVLPLNKDADFGKIKVDTKACTLCHSCVSVCPVGAVLDGGDIPQLNFIEDLCVQCGLCETACPEDAISLIPQYLFDREQARKLRLLHEEAIFHCIDCDKGFATKKMIDTMMDKLKGHAMFQGDALNRLKLCEDCRVKAIYKDANQ
ncbi:MAG: 4Fe-4S binding protein [Piscirickettsiaceae bacterium]|nr:4Fe-4S binding protein [Piscirickettsiaceae bacterium]